MTITITITVTITVAITITIKVTITIQLQLKHSFASGISVLTVGGGFAVHLEGNAPHGEYLAGMEF